MANKMILQNIMGAPVMAQTASPITEFSALSLVMSFPSKKAFEIQFDITSIANPIPKRTLDYVINSGGLSNFKNLDYSHVIGISAKSKQYLNCCGKSDTNEWFYTIPTTDLN